MAFRFVFLVLCVFEGGITVLANDVVPEGVQNARGCSFFATDRAKRHIYNDIMPISWRAERREKYRVVAGAAEHPAPDAHRHLDELYCCHKWLFGGGRHPGVKTLINTLTFPPAGRSLLFYFLLPPLTTARVVL